MNRVLPFIFVTTGLVAFAVFQAHAERGSRQSEPLAMADPITVDLLGPNDLR